jgi:hypothetical protein
MMASVAKQAGALKSIAYKKEETRTVDGEFELLLLYEVVCEKASTVASVSFRFADLKGHFVGFDFTHDK